MKKNELALAYLAMTVFALAVGFSFMSVKASVESATSLQTITFRFTAAFLAALVLRAVCPGKISFKGGDKKHLLLSAFTYVAFMGLQAFALMYTTSIVSGIMFAVVPIFAQVVGSVVLKEKATWLQNAFALLSVGAVVAMFALGAGDSLRSVSIPGFLLLLVSSFCCAVSNVYMRGVKRDYSPFSISFCCCGMGCGCFWLLSAFKLLAEKGSVRAYFAPLADLRFVAAMLYLGVLCTLITGALISFALRTLPAMSATIFGNLSTAISVAAGAILLGEPLYGYQLVCTGLIVVGVLGISLCTSREEAKARELTKKTGGADGN